MAYRVVITELHRGNGDYHYESAVVSVHGSLQDARDAAARIEREQANNHAAKTRVHVDY